jgi:hypothetical protein
MMTVALAADLVRWSQLLCVDDTRLGARTQGTTVGPSSTHPADSRGGHVVHMIDGWSAVDVLLGTYRGFRTGYQTTAR